MSYLLYLTLLYSILFSTFAKASYLGGIPVPGLTVPVLRLFENYAASCRPSQRKDFGMNQLSEIMQSFNAEDVVHKVYNSLFIAMGDIQLERIMGKWYRVVDSKSVHRDDCAVFYFDLISKTDYTGTFTSKEYTLMNNQVLMHEGYGRMMGPDPGELLITTGHPEDVCPFFPVKLGGLDQKGDYDYIILSTPLKYPTMVFARDMTTFERKYRREVYEFVEKHGFLSPVAALNTRLHFVNTTECHQKNGLLERP